jgi:hypothetical protein
MGLFKGPFSPPSTLKRVVLGTPQTPAGRLRPCTPQLRDDVIKALCEFASFVAN